MATDTNTIISTSHTRHGGEALFHVAPSSMVFGVIPMQPATATPIGISFRGMTLPHGIESIWPRLAADNAFAEGGIRLATAGIPIVGMRFPDTPLTPNVNSTPCQSRGRNRLKH